MTESTANDPVETAAGAPVFVNPPLSRSLALGFLAGHLFGGWWIYRNWRYLQEREDADCLPFWRAFFSILFVYPTLKAVQHDPVASARAQADYASGPLAAGWIVLSCTGSTLSRLHDPVCGIVAAVALATSTLFLLPSLLYIREINSPPYGNVPHEPWTWGQVVIAILGALMWLGTFVSLLRLGFGAA